MDMKKKQIAELSTFQIQKQIKIVFYTHDDVMSVTIRETLEFVYVNNVNGALCGENTANINSTLQSALSNLNISNGTLELEEIFIFMGNIFLISKNLI